MVNTRNAEFNKGFLLKIVVLDFYTIKCWTKYSVYGIK